MAIYKGPLIGNKYGLLTVIEDLGVIQHGYARMRMVKAECICGKVKKYRLSSIKCGQVVSCGNHRDFTISPGDKRVSHSLRHHQLYTTYYSMIGRCYNLGNSSYYMYGKRGVIVCEEWRSDFMSFYNWATANGWSRELQLDKDIKAKELGLEPLLYSPDRCQFVTAKKNSNNRRSNAIISYNGKNKSISEWSEETGIGQQTLRARLSLHGWDIERALTTPLVKPTPPWIKKK